MTADDPMPCAHDDCTQNARQTTLYRINEQGVPGVFMCVTHWYAATAHLRATVGAARVRRPEGTR